VFLILEDATDESRQYRIYLKADDPEAVLPDYQVYCDGFEVPREVLIWLQGAMDVRFYVTEDRQEMMMEFPHTEPEELPVLQ
jgi:hypothetical protein